LNTLNPSITALTPLTIPVVQELRDSTLASRLCDFDAEIDETAHEPIRCESSKVINAAEGEKCAGLWSSDPDNICVIETITGPNSLVKTTEKSEITMQNHTYTSQTTFDVKNDEWFISNQECGDVYWGITGVTGGAYMVGSHCGWVNFTDGAPQWAHCVMDGKFGNFSSDASKCSWILLDILHDNGSYIPADEARKGCGRVTNMRCAGD
jgi:hypothetical protein